MQVANHVDLQNFFRARNDGIFGPLHGGVTRGKQELRFLCLRLLRNVTGPVRPPSVVDVLFQRLVLDRDGVQGGLANRPRKSSCSTCWP
jgi:hypothetical protein